jgi:hypothetical protein
MCCIIGCLSFYTFCTDGTDAIVCNVRHHNDRAWSRQETLCSSGGRMDLQLTGKTAVVTGASKGIGRMLRRIFLWANLASRVISRLRFSFWLQLQLATSRALWCPLMAVCGRAFFEATRWSCRTDCELARRRGGELTTLFLGYLARGTSGEGARVCREG